MSSADCCDPVPPVEEASNAPLLVPPPVPATTLVTRRDVVPCRTDTRETDAVSALRRGLAEYLSQVQLDVAGAAVRFARVLDVWSDSETDADYPAAVVQIAGDAEYDAAGFTPTIDPTDKTPDGRYLVKTSEVTVELQVEAHCSSPGQRIGVAMLLEDAMNPVDWMHGFRLDLPHYYGERGEYEVTRADFKDVEADARHELRPLILSVEARVSQVRTRSLPNLDPKLIVTVTADPLTPVVTTSTT